MGNAVQQSYDNVMLENKEEILKSILSEFHSLEENKLSNNYENKKQGRKLTFFAAVGFAVAACALFAMFVLPALLKTPDVKPDPVAEISPAPTTSDALVKPPENKIPAAYSQRLCSVAVQSGDWVYYSNPEDNSSLYKVSQNSSDPIKLSDDRYVNIIDIKDGWIFYECYNGYNLRSYYDNFSSKSMQEMFDHGMDISFKELVKIKTDGSGRTKLYLDSSEYRGFYTEIIDDYIYIIGFTDIYKMQINDTKLTPVLSLPINYKDPSIQYGIEAYAIKDEWIYYVSESNFNTGSKLYRVKTDGTQLTLLRKKIGVYPINKHIGFSGDFIIITDGKGISKISLDGKIKKTIYKGHHKYGLAVAAVIDDYVYFEETFNSVNGPNRYEFCKLNINTKEKTVIADDILAGRMLIDGEWIYYTQYIQENSNNGIAPLCKIKTDGTQKQKLANGDCYDLHLANDELYFSKIEGLPYEPGTFYKINKDGTGEQKVSLLNEIINVVMLKSAGADNETSFIASEDQSGEKLLEEENINGISIGMSVEEIEAILGKSDNPNERSFCVMEDDSEDGYGDIHGVQYRYNKKAIELLYLNNKDYKDTLYLACFGENSDTKTSRGVGIGSTKEEVLEVYKNEFNSDHTKGFENQLIVIGSRNCGIVFFLDETSGTVTSFVIGRSG